VTRGNGRAVVVGAGPNGLTAAAVLAGAGLAVEVYESAATIGGGARSAELTMPGLVHDVCSAIHPLGVTSPAFTELGDDLARHGLRWAWPDVDLAHPLDGGRAALLHRSIDETVAGLGNDGAAWRRTFAGPSRAIGALLDDVCRPPLHLPRHPLTYARFCLAAVQPATWFARRWRSDEARALFAGIAAHVIQPLDRPFSASVGLLLGATGHSGGWPVAVGGSQRIADALAAIVVERGGRIETGRSIGSLAELDEPEVVMLDLAPGAAADVIGDRLAPRVERAYRRFRHGPGAFKLDLAVDGGVPWTNEGCRRAGTVHVGGTFEQVAAAETDIARGRLPERPFVLVGQQYLADTSRSHGDVHPVWAYAHVPVGFSGDATDIVLGHLERFAPGLRDRVVGVAARGPDELASYNANYVGGDIATGATDPRQLLFRPRVAADPYATGVPGVFLCSAATPPGAGVHGMCGWNAAASVLRRLQAR
jgi:phytoene dehydrogenase-like protein